MRRTEYEYANTEWSSSEGLATGPRKPAGEGWRLIHVAQMVGPDALYLVGTWERLALGDEAEGAKP